jgi:hypothetical protein
VGRRFRLQCLRRGEAGPGPGPSHTPHSGWARRRQRRGQEEGGVRAEGGGVGRGGVRTAGPGIECPPFSRVGHGAVQGAGGLGCAGLEKPALRGGAWPAGHRREGTVIRRFDAERGEGWVNVESAHGLGSAAAQVVGLRSPQRRKEGKNGEGGGGGQASPKMLAVEPPSVPSEEVRREGGGEKRRNGEWPPTAARGRERRSLTG